MVNVTVLCIKCNYEFTMSLKSIDAFHMKLPHTCPSCPRCRRKKWLRRIEPGIHAGATD